MWAFAPRLWVRGCEVITLELTLHEAELLGQALAGHSTHVEKVCESFAGNEDKYRAAHDYFKQKLKDVQLLHVKVVQARVG